MMFWRVTFTWRSSFYRRPFPLTSCIKLISSLFYLSDKIFEIVKTQNNTSQWQNIIFVQLHKFNAVLPGLSSTAGELESGLSDACSASFGWAAAMAASLSASSFSRLARSAASAASFRLCISFNSNCTENI